jgi:monovalent cation:H+ antiporter-2, CPA2 family
MMQDEGARIRSLALQQINEKYPWPIQLTEFVIREGTQACGVRISELSLRTKTGASIIGINRHGFTEYDPDPSTRLFPEDHLFILGEDKQLDQATTFLEQKISSKLAEQHAVPTFGLQQVFIGKDSILVGETLASSNIRRRFGVNVVGIQRDDKKITSPVPEEMIKLGDVLIVAGSQRAIEAFTWAQGDFTQI